MIATLSIFIENIYYCSVLLGAMIRHPLSPEGVHPQISSSMRLLILCLVRLHLFVIFYCLFIFSKNISFIGSLDKCHTSVFKALIFFIVLSQLFPLSHSFGIDCRACLNRICNSESGFPYYN